MMIYNSINNCPVGVWDRVIRTGYLAYLGGSSDKQRNAAYNKIRDEYTKEIGLPNWYHKYLMKMIQSFESYIEAYESGHRHFITIAKVLEAEAVTEMNSYLSSSEEEIEVTAAKISKHFGFHIDTEKVSIKQFHAYLKAI